MVTRPAVAGKMGSTPFYQTVVTARELAHSVRAASDDEAGWAAQSIDERMQRKLNKTRVTEALVPYLAHHPDRFFGSLIVLAPANSLTFEPLEELLKDLPMAYRSSAESLGFLTVADKGALIALDGQHRLAALREVVTSDQQLGPHQRDVVDDEVSVILIEAENDQKTRGIFNRLNRHAKPTGRSDNIITSEDDGYAMLSRRLLDVGLNAPFAPKTTDGVTEELVNWTTTTISKRSRALTTLSALYEITKLILDAEPNRFAKFSGGAGAIAPPEKDLDAGFEVLESWWNDLLTGIAIFRLAVADNTELPEIRNSTTDPRALLLRPVGQMALVRGLVQALDSCKASRKDLIKKCNAIDWSSGVDSYWRDVLVAPNGRMITRADAIKLGGTLIAWLLVGESIGQEAEADLYRDWNRARGKDVDKPLAEFSDDDQKQIPEDLPEPL